MMKVRKMLKIMLLVAVMMIGMTFTTNAATKSNEQIALDYCAKYCVNYEAEVVGYNHVPTNRTDSQFVYIEKIKTKSLGNRWGRTRDGYKVEYNKPVKKGKTEIVYLIYNPESDACDDIMCKVANKKMKADKVKLYRHVNCVNCDGTSSDCVYYIHNLHRHMTEQEIIDFEESEWDRYSDYEMGVDSYEN